MPSPTTILSLVCCIVLDILLLIHSKIPLPRCRKGIYLMWGVTKSLQSLQGGDGDDDPDNDKEEEGEDDGGDHGSDDGHDDNDDSAGDGGGGGDHNDGHHFLNTSNLNTLHYTQYGVSSLNKPNDKSSSLTPN